MGVVGQRPVPHQRRDSRQSGFSITVFAVQELVIAVIFRNDFILQLFASRDYHEMSFQTVKSMFVYVLLNWGRCISKVLSHWAFKCAVWVLYFQVLIELNLQLGWMNLDGCLINLSQEVGGHLFIYLFLNTNPPSRGLLNIHLRDLYLFKNQNSTKVLMTHKSNI